MSDLSAFQHPRFARMYERISRESVQRGTAEHRERALAGLSGRVIEVGAGNGMNFEHYPDTVTEVLAVEPEDRLRALAEKAAAQTPVPVRVVAGHADALPAQDAAFDAVVASLVLCSVPDVAGALAEIRRVLRPGGELRFFEHVRSDKPWFSLLQDTITPLWSRAGGGCPQPGHRRGHPQGGLPRRTARPVLLRPTAVLPPSCAHPRARPHTELRRA
ncbi:MAG: class I SAM-dependent methyltransferase, partial [Pseudonocardiaceae bacterium]